MRNRGEGGGKGGDQGGAVARRGKRRLYGDARLAMLTVPVHSFQGSC